MAKDLTKKMKDFADYYLESGNIYQSAIRAGYSENYAKGNAIKLFENERVQKYVNEMLEKLRSERVASIQEVLEYLTKGIRQELEEEVVVTEGENTRIVKKKISLRDSNKCAELLAKRYGLLTDKVNLEGTVSVVVVDDVEEDS